MSSQHEERKLDAIRAIEQCKGVLRHAWYETTTDRVPEFGSHYIANRCERCGHERVMAVGTHGQKVSNWRYIPQDKDLYKSVQAASMDEWRERYIASLNNNKGRK